MFEEAEPEFQQFAYFKTRICMRNALQVSLTIETATDIVIDSFKLSLIFYPESDEVLIH